jgi:hypothetical protein
MCSSFPTLDALNECESDAGGLILLVVEGEELKKTEVLV